MRLVPNNELTRQIFQSFQYLSSTLEIFWRYFIQITNIYKSCKLCKTIAYKIEVILSKVCIMTLYTIKYCMFREL